MVVVFVVVVGFIIILMSTMRSFRWSEKKREKLEREIEKKKYSEKKKKKVFSLSNYRSGTSLHQTMLVGDEFLPFFFFFIVCCNAIKKK